MILNELPTFEWKDDKIFSSVLSVRTGFLQLEALMRSDPFIVHGLAEFDVIEFQTSQSHPDFKNVFKE